MKDKTQVKSKTDDNGQSVLDQSTSKEDDISEETKQEIRKIARRRAIALLRRAVEKGRLIEPIKLEEKSPSNLPLYKEAVRYFISSCKDMWLKQPETREFYIRKFHEFFCTTIDPRK